MSGRHEYDYSIVTLAQDRRHESGVERAARAATLLRGVAKIVPGAIVESVDTGRQTTRIRVEGETSEAGRNTSRVLAIEPEFNQFGKFNVSGSEWVSIPLREERWFESVTVVMQRTVGEPELPSAIADGVAGLFPGQEHQGMRNGVRETLGLPLEQPQS